MRKQVPFFSFFLSEDGGLERWKANTTTEPDCMVATGLRCVTQLDAQKLATGDCIMRYMRRLGDQSKTEIA